MVFNSPHRFSSPHSSPPPFPGLILISRGEGGRKKRGPSEPDGVEAKEKLGLEQGSTAIGSTFQPSSISGLCCMSTYASPVSFGKD